MMSENEEHKIERKHNENRKGNEKYKNTKWKKSGTKKMKEKGQR